MGFDGRCTLLCVLGILFLPTSSFAILKGISDAIENVVFTTKCTKHYGCFYTGPPFYHPTLRPISVPPWHEDRITTRFFLSTRDNLDKPYLLKTNDSDLLTSSPFKRNQSVKFFVHGFNVAIGGTGEFEKIKKAYLMDGHYEYNVVEVDWGDSDGDPYMQAVANGRVVGAQIAEFVQFLERSGVVKRDSVHLMGYSLGAQVCGWAGERLPGLGRITGFDPVGLYFRNSPPEVRLDHTDANFVDIIHTNAAEHVIFGLGDNNVLGDIDFYVNGGATQPGCKCMIERLNPVGKEIYSLLVEKDTNPLKPYLCSHSRAVDYFVESIVSSSRGNCSFIGTECESYKKYQSGGCQGNRQEIMGEEAVMRPSTRGKKFYFDTNSEPPFCKTG